MIPYRLSDHAKSDVAIAMYRYETESPGLGDDLLAELAASLQFVSRYPNMYQVEFDDIRRVLTRRFPYAVFYRLEPGLIEVIGVLHHHVDPDALQSRA